MQLIWTSDERPVAATRGATCESRKRHVLVPRGAEERVRRRKSRKRAVEAQVHVRGRAKPKRRGHGAPAPGASHPCYPGAAARAETAAARPGGNRCRGGPRASGARRSAQRGVARAVGEAVARLLAVARWAVAPTTSPTHGLSRRNCATSRAKPAWSLRGVGAPETARSVAAPRARSRAATPACGVSASASNLFWAHAAMAASSSDFAMLMPAAWYPG